MQSILEQSHLLDSALARACAYLSIAILMGIWIWEYWFKSKLPNQRFYRWAAFLIGLTGLIIAVSGTALEAGDPFNIESMNLPDLTTVAKLFLTTHFGQAWFSYAAFLLLTVFSPWKSLYVAAIVGMVGSLVLSSHAAEDGIANPIFWIDFFHLFFGLLWMGGLTMLMLLKFGQVEKIQIPELRFFSRIALPIFTLILLTGVSQALYRLYLEKSFNLAYLIVLGIKLILVLAIMLSAFGLRRYLKQNHPSMLKFDNGLTLEYFFAILLLFTISLLTQLSPL